MSEAASATSSKCTISAGAAPAKARELGNINPGDGARFHGRGYVQLTGAQQLRQDAEKIPYRPHKQR